MKTLKFDEELAKKIIAGEKRSTWRLFDDKNLCAGDRIEFVVRETGEVFACVEATSVREKALGEVEKNDFEKHESYESQETMLETFRRYYGERVSFKTPVKIIEFTLL